MKFDRKSAVMYVTKVVPTAIRRPVPLAAVSSTAVLNARFEKAFLEKEERVALVNSMMVMEGEVKDAKAFGLWFASAKFRSSFAF
jgi:uncharacterized membrane protein (DUF2068 family)